MKQAAPTFQAPPLTLPDRLALVFATGAGAGYSPVAPGTFGTAAAIPLFFALSFSPQWAQVLGTAAAVAIAMVAAHRAAIYFGASDDQRIVSDEVAGYLVTMALLPATPKAIVAGFVFFRLFDILKPWPASYFDRRLPNAIGNVLDDVAAGFYAHLCLQLLLFVWP